MGDSAIASGHCVDPRVECRNPEFPGNNTAPEHAMSCPGVSVVIPTRNRVNQLRQFLEAFLEQEYPEGRSEVAVVDDGSTDMTRAVVTEMATHFCELGKRLSYLTNRGRGTNAALNTGVKAAREELIVIAGDDTLPPPRWLMTLIEGLIKSGAEAVSGPLRIPTAGPLVGRHREEVAACLTDINGPAYWRDGLVPVAGNMAVWRHVFDRALFDEEIQAPVEEIDWVLKAGVRCGFVPEAWAWHNKPVGSLRLPGVLGIAWHRGSETGWWMRERLQMPSKERLPLALRGAQNCARALAHAAIFRCWGGVVVGIGELSRAMALAGLINLGDRRPERQP